MPTRATAPRVWLAGIGPAPAGQPVRDDQQRVWSYAADGRYHTADGRHHDTPAGLHARTDLVAVGRVR